MRAAWYDRQGPADRGSAGSANCPTPSRHRRGPSPRALVGRESRRHEKAAGWLGSSMPFPRVIPHSDAAGIIDAVGNGVDAGRTRRAGLGVRRPVLPAFGTAAEFTVVPATLAVDLPDAVGDELAACLGIPGITAHRAVFADGPISGRTVLVHGVLGGVGSLAVQLAVWAGATVIAHGSTR